MERTRTSLDTYQAIPEDMENYLLHYGKHFNKYMYEWAVSKMKKKDGTTIKPITKEEFTKKLALFGIRLENDVLYDGMYVHCMGMADYYGSSIIDEKHLFLYVKDSVDDVDAVDGQIFNRFYADCCIKGIPIDWSNML